MKSRFIFCDPSESDSSQRYEAPHAHKMSGQESLA
jgi:hypothetical protein